MTEQDKIKWLEDNFNDEQFADFMRIRMDYLTMRHSWKSLLRLIELAFAAGRSAERQRLAS